MLIPGGMNYGCMSPQKRGGASLLKNLQQFIISALLLDWYGYSMTEVSFSGSLLIDSNFPKVST